jgi:hypothetical protein
MTRGNRHACATGLGSREIRSLRDLRRWFPSHAVLTQRLDVRQVRENDAVIALSTGYGELAFGEGKFGGVAQVIVVANAGIRALSSGVSTWWMPGAA